MRAEIIRWFPDRGYGFAKQVGGGAHDLYLHISDVAEGVPHQGAMIECKVETVARLRRNKAIKVRVQ
jgi:cold shock CspA family protein